MGAQPPSIPLCCSPTNGFLRLIQGELDTAELTGAYFKMVSRLLHLNMTDLQTQLQRGRAGGCSSWSQPYRAGSSFLESAGGRGGGKAVNQDPLGDLESSGWFCTPNKRNPAVLGCTGLPGHEGTVLWVPTARLGFAVSRA